MALRTKALQKKNNYKNLNSYNFYNIYYYKKYPY